MGTQNSLWTHSVYLSLEKNIQGWASFILSMQVGRPTNFRSTALCGAHLHSLGTGATPLWGDFGDCSVAHNTPTHTPLDSSFILHHRFNELWFTCHLNRPDVGYTYLVKLIPCHLQKINHPDPQLPFWRRAGGCEHPPQGSQSHHQRSLVTFSRGISQPGTCPGLPWGSY